MTLERALTLKEWEAQQRRGTPLPERIGWAVAEVDTYGDLGRHGLAALCLHGMPYGFTLLDVQTLRQVAPFIIGASKAFPELDAWAQGLADRIEALLPPPIGETISSEPLGVSEGSPPTP